MGLCNRWQGAGHECWKLVLQDTWQLHWPLINSDHMRYKLAQRELEQKRIEDGDR